MVGRPMARSSSDRAFQLARRLAALSETSLRVSYVRRYLADLDAQEAADLVTVAVAMAEASEPDFSRLLLTVSMALADPGLDGLRDSIAATLAARQQPRMARMFQRDTDATSSEEPQRVPDVGLGRTPTLGERKAWARTHDRRRLGHVLRDPHPDVVRVVLSNPHLTERDVVFLCAQRPVPPDVLRTVFASERWIVRYAVKLTVARNPHTPLDVALQLAPHLRAPDRRTLAASPELAPALREACKTGGAHQTLH